MNHKLDTERVHLQSIEAVIDVMREDPSRPLDLVAMSRVACMSRYHFLRVFEEITSVTPVRFLSALRIQQAKRLLIETSLPVTTICFDCGYNSLGTFTRVFSDWVGASPGTFRRLRDDLSERGMDDLMSTYLRQRQRTEGTVLLMGEVLGPGHLHGYIFVGLFAAPIPRKRPLAGTILTAPGRFQFPVAPVMRDSFLLAAALPMDSNGIGCLLPEQNHLLVGAQPIRSGYCPDDVGSTSLVLRRTRPVDPPILIALPLLLTSDPQSEGSHSQPVGVC